MSADLPKTYRFLSLSDLPDHQKSDAPQECSAESAAILNAALAAIGAQPEGKSVGAAVTRYYVRLPEGMSLGKLMGLKNELSMRLHGSELLIGADEERNTAFIDVPNSVRAVVSWKQAMLSQMCAEHTSKLSFVLGQTPDGSTEIVDLVRLPHLLVGGASGAGKSIFLHAMIASLFCRYSPEEVRFVLIDLKGTESDIFSDLPHLARPVVRDAAEAVRALGCAIAEMERRYSLMRQKAEQGIVVRNLDEYNRAVSEGERFPRIVIAADEYADILLCEKKDLVENVVTLARKARAAGIHLVFSTQRCSAEVLSGDLLANFPSRIALRVATEAESRRLLGQSGAQSLVCAGDMLLHTAEMLSCRRVQGVFIADRDVRTLVQEICALDDARPALSAFCS